jgi:hypothetical protein
VRKPQSSWTTQIDTNRRFVRRIQESEVKEDLKKMKIGKALGSDDIPIEV